MAEHPTRHTPTPHPDADEGDTRRKRDMRRRETDVQAETGRHRGGRGLEDFKHPLLLLAGGAATYAGIKRFGHLSGLFLMGVGGGMIYRVLDDNELLDGRIKQQLLQTAASGTTHLHTAVTVDLPVEEVYGKWRSLENLGKTMHHLESAESLGDDRWHFRARVPKVDMTVEWDAEIVEDREHEHLSWRSTDEADIDHEGVVEFRSRSDGERTEIHVDLLYHPPGAGAGQALGQFLRGLSEQTLKEDVRRFKQYLETGVVATIEGQTSGRRTLEKLETTERQSRPSTPTIH